MNKVVLLLGSNLGNKKNNISKALSYITQEIGVIQKTSDLVETTPEGYQSQNYYLNQGIVVNTGLSPIQLLRSVKGIERKLGRMKDSSDSGKYEDRTIDIDIIFFNNLNFLSTKLTIPHLAHTLTRNFSEKILNQLT